MTSRAAKTPKAGRASPRPRKAGRVHSWTGYMKLVREFPLRPLDSERELDQAIAVADRLIDRVQSLSPDERAYLDVLGGLIHAYEEKRHPIEDPTEGDMLAHLLEARGVSQRQCALAVKLPRSIICELLSGKRRMMLDHIHKFAAYFNVPPGRFVATPKSPKNGQCRAKPMPWEPERAHRDPDAWWRVRRAVLANQRRGALDAMTWRNVVTVERFSAISRAPDCFSASPCDTNSYRTTCNARERGLESEELCEFSDQSSNAPKSAAARAAYRRSGIANFATIRASCAK